MIFISPTRASRFRRKLARPATFALLVASVACQNTPAAFGSTRVEASHNSNTFFSGLASRFTNVVRMPRFDDARQRISRHALSPSGIFNDTSVWTSSSGARRTLGVDSRTRGSGYVFEAQNVSFVPTRSGDAWHYMHLTRLANSEYRWDTGVDFAVGQVEPNELLDVWRSVLAPAGAYSEPVLRAGYRTAFPRTTRALGRLASIDSLRSTRHADGSATVDMVVSLDSDRLRAAGFPAFARYVERYVEPARYDVVFSDGQGARWLMATARDNRLAFRLRTANGRLAPLEGAVRPMPTRLRMEASLSAKFSIFRVGASRLVADVEVLDDPGERGWDFRFKREPNWHFPLAVRHFISAPLRRPFAGDGIHFRLTAVRSPGSSTTFLARRTTVAVQESAIVRWLGGLGSDAMSDFAGEAEREQNRFAAEVFRALAHDASGGPGAVDTRAVGESAGVP